MPESAPESPRPVIPDHELLRPIGRGSYGEVWLARNTLGELRALKLIHFDGHDDDRPVEREIEGLRKFEPISRSHPGLVHRDLKPSNIIFVRGQPKLADIGLVASADASMSCVGTEGYLPPEGPGKPPADLYILGKVLYELATGRDRTDFPELPTLLREDAQREALEEFNEVILKACDPDQRRRYQTAARMQADAELLHTGKSLQQVRRRARGWAHARRLTVVTGVALALVAGVRWRSPNAAPAGPLAPRPLAVEKPYARFDVSPDGERIAFTPPVGVLLWDRKTSTTRRLEIRGADGWLTPGISGAVGIPRWAPDGRQLAFMPVKQIGGTADGPTNAFATFLVDSQTGEARQFGTDLSETNRLQGWCWQPDGLGLAAVTQDRRFFTR